VSSNLALLRDGDAPLDAGEVDAFARDGFLRLERLASDQEVAQLRSTFDRLFGGDVDIPDADRVRLARDDAGAGVLTQVLNPDTYAPELRETSVYGAAFALARQLLGPDAHRMGMHAILKPPRHGAETPWHQDEAYWDAEWDYRAISVWLPLQPATVENGCLHFVPGSHLLEVQEHRLADEGAEALMLSEPAPDLVASSVACPIPVGGATVHANRTVHYAGPNLTGAARRALVFAFSAPGKRRSEPRQFPWQPDRWFEQPS
jgi:ectoine hydroxylase-related dioxygenase (phytanoyl-CoA dioxygenase family)